MGSLTVCDEISEYVYPRNLIHSFSYKLMLFSLYFNEILSFFTRFGKCILNHIQLGKMLDTVACVFPKYHKIIHNN